jgi:hypothetical protein
MSIRPQKRRVPVMRASLRTIFSVACLCAPGVAFPYVSAIGLSDVRAQWFENEELFFYGPNPDDHFAIALAAGDFNGDGASDLASGIPDDDEIGGGCASCGMVVVRWGVPGRGLAPGLADTVLHQGLAASPSEPIAGERFGAQLAAGDFNGDGFDDLAVGAPGPPIAGVQIYYGWTTGFQTEHAEYFTELDVSNGEDFCSFSHFGESLAVGNFDHDAFDDLAVGAWNTCDVDGDDVDRGGAVYVGHGQSWGILPWFGYRISQDEVEMQDVAEEGDQFGRAIAAGHFDSDSYDDLAIGVPGENDSGMIQLLSGSPWGLLFATNIIWLPGALGELPEPGDRLGWSLAAGDFDGDLYQDLAIGNPNEDLGDSNEKLDVGSIAVAFGSSAGFDLSRTLGFRQGSLYGSNAFDAEGDLFGWALAAGDFDGDGLWDLAVGHPGDDISAGNAGAVSVLMGGFGSGLGTRNRLLGPGARGVPGSIQSNQDFGGVLAIGDFDATGYADLAIGVPFYNISTMFDVGGEAVLYGSMFADGFEAGLTDRWSAVAP